MLVTAGCLGPSEGSLDGDYNEDEFDSLLDEQTAAYEELDTYTAEMEMQMDAEEGQSVTMSMDGDIDLVNEQMKVEYAMSGATAPGQPNQFVVYIDADTAYMEVGDDEWEEVPLEQVDDGMWEADDLGGEESMYDWGDVHVDDRGDEVVVTTELDGDQMEEAIDETDLDDPALDDVEGVDWHSVKMVETIDPETNMHTNIEVTASFEERGQTIDMEYEMTIDDYNEDIDASAPEEVVEQAEGSNTQI